MKDALNKQHKFLEEQYFHIVNAKEAMKRELGNILHQDLKDDFGRSIEAFNLALKNYDRWLEEYEVIYGNFLFPNPSPDEIAEEYKRATHGE